MFAVWLILTPLRYEWAPALNLWTWYDSVVWLTQPSTQPCTQILSKCEFLFNKLKTWWVREPFSQNWWIRPNPSNPCWRGPCTAKNTLHGSITRHDWRLAWKVLTCLPVWKIFVLMQDPVWIFDISSPRNLLFMCFFFSSSSCCLLK